MPVCPFLLARFMRYDLERNNIVEVVWAERKRTY
jgi:hypothetical protein